MDKIYGITLKSEGKIYYFNGQNLELEKDSYVVGAENKIVSALFSIEYRIKNNNELSYDNNCCKKRCYYNGK